MSEQNLVKKVLTIAGMPSDKKVVKFKDASENELEDKWYQTSQKVQELDLKKYGVTSGAKVEVSFDANDDMKIVFISKVKEGKTETKKTYQKKEAPKTETKQDTTQEAEETKAWTVGAVSKDKKFIKFNEDTEKWRNASSEVMALDYQAIGIIKGANVTVTLKGKTITAITVLGDPLPPQGGTGETPRNSGANNIDRQSAVKSSAEIIKALIEAGKITSVNEAENALKQLSRTATELIG